MKEQHACPTCGGATSKNKNGKIVAAASADKLRRMQVLLEAQAQKIKRLSTSDFQYGEYNLHFELPFQTISNNEYSRMNRYAQHRYKNMMVSAIWALVPKSKRPKTPLTKCEIVVTRHCGSEGLDEDNMHGGMKPLFDSLEPHPKGIGIIADDSPKCVVRRMLVPVKCKRGNGRTEVVVREVL